MVRLMIRKEIGTRIKQIREISGLSQEKFAERCNLDRTYINSLENGRRNISVDTLAKICDAFGISYLDFFDFNKVDFPFIKYESISSRVVDGRRLITLPCGNDLAFDHYNKTLVAGADINMFDESIRDLYSNGIVYVWGQTDGVKNTNLTRFEVIKPGDIAVFVRKGKIISKGTVIKTDISEKLSIDLWGTLDGKPWKNLIFFNKIEELDVSVKDFNLAVGYKPKNIIQSFTTNLIVEEHPDLMKLLNI